MPHSKDSQFMALRIPRRMKIQIAEFAHEAGITQKEALMNAWEYFIDQRREQIIRGVKKDISEEMQKIQHKLDTALTHLNKSNATIYEQLQSVVKRIEQLEK